MARRRSPAVRTRRKSKGLPKADWVYRSHSQRGDTGVQMDSLGTYDSTFVQISSGAVNAQSHILYDSQDQMAAQTGGGFNVGATVPRYISRAARAEGKRPLILATEGLVLIQPSTWALGNVIAWGMRIGAFEQDRTGVFSIDGAFSMWADNPVVPFEKIAVWANQARTNVYERRVWREFNSTQTSPLFPVHVRWRGRRRLDPKDCWGLYSEVDSTGITTRQHFYLRTLVVDDSA